MTQNDQNPTTKGCGIILAVGVVLFVFSKMCGSGDSQNSNYSEASALVMSRHFVEDQLKAPATADFSDDTENVVKINDSTYDVQSYVDSENSFGAKLRSRYSCTIVFLKDDQVRCENLVID
jgi:hypothetical protein